MKKTIAVLTILPFLFLGLGFVPSANAQTAEIASVEAAKDIASAAGGTYISGATAPALSGGQVALPVIQEASGEIIGYVVAEQASLVSALNAAGLVEVATAVAAVEAGTIAGLTVTAGVISGTTIAAVAGGAGLIALAVSAASNDGGGSTTTHH